MMQQTSNYDRDLQMYREPLGPVNLTHLRFLRWLVEHDRLGHRPAGPPSGEFAEPPTPDTPGPTPVSPPSEPVSA